MNMTMNTTNKYKMDSLENNKLIYYNHEEYCVSGKDTSHTRCTKCELKGHAAKACRINLKRSNKCKSQTVHNTDPCINIKCTKCDLDGHSAEKCYINLRRRKPQNTEKIAIKKNTISIKAIILYLYSKIRLK